MLSDGCWYKIPLPWLRALILTQLFAVSNQLVMTWVAFCVAAQKRLLKTCWNGSQHGSGFLLISTEQIGYGGAFIRNTYSEDCFYLNKSVRDPLPLSSPGCINALSCTEKKLASRLLGATCSLKNPYAPVPLCLHAIFHLWREKWSTSIGLHLVFFLGSVRVLQLVVRP